MKNLHTTLCLVLIPFVFACSPGDQNTSDQTESTESTAQSETDAEPAVTGNFNVDLQQSSINWVGKKVIGDQHVGTIKVSEGVFAVNEGSVASGQFTIDMTSITNTDPMSDEDRAKLEGHLMSGDFFDAQTYPTASFNITSVEVLESGDGTHTITGDLTLKDVTKSISFPANILMNANGMSASASMNLNRADYNVKYGSAKFFTDLIKDRIIEDEIELNINLIASN